MDNLKTLLDRVVMSVFRYVQRIIPYRTRKNLALSTLSRLNEYDTYDILIKLSKEKGIEGFLAKGNSGTFEGYIDDKFIIKGYIQEKEWSKEVNGIICEALKGGGCFIDIGANIGLTLVPVARLPNVNCFAFEPDIGNYICLVNNLNRNVPDAKIESFKCALSDENGESFFQMSDDNYGDHHLTTADVRENYNSEITHGVKKVRVSRLDDLQLKIPTPLVVKVDAQGAEPKILRGGIRTIGAAALLIIEFSPFHISRIGEGVDEMLSFLADNFDNINVLQNAAELESSWALSKDHTLKALKVFNERWKDIEGDSRGFIDLIATKAPRLIGA